MMSLWRVLTKVSEEITEQEFAQSLVGTLNEVTSASVAMALDRCRKHGVKVVKAAG